MKKKLTRFPLFEKTVYPVSEKVNPVSEKVYPVSETL